MSFKFCFIQLNDLSDLLTVLAIIFILKYSQLTFFQDLTDEAFTRYASMCGIETALEITYTLVMPVLIRKYTKYTNFYPLVAGRDLFFRYAIIFVLIIGLLFALVMHLMLFTPI